MPALALDIVGAEVCKTWSSSGCKRSLLWSDPRCSCRCEVFVGLDEVPRFGV